MTKWIEQEAEKKVQDMFTDLNGEPGKDFYFHADHGIDIFKAGATATLNKVRELIEKTKGGDLGFVLREWDMGREALRKDLLKELEGL